MKNKKFMHEYGHTFDSRLFGLSYLFAIGIPSASGAKWTEIRANRRAKSYFKKWIDWDEYITPNHPHYWGTYEYYYPTK
jgi:hypothetical protein